MECQSFRDLQLVPNGSLIVKVVSIVQYIQVSFALVRTAACMSDGTRHFCSAETSSVDHP